MSTLSAINCISYVKFSVSCTSSMCVNKLTATSKVTQEMYRTSCWSMKKLVSLKLTDKVLMLKVGWAREGDEEKGEDGGGEGEEGRKGEREEKEDVEESMKKEEGKSGRKREITA